MTMPPPQVPEPISDAQRHALLSQAVANAVATRGARVESQTSTQAVLVTGKQVNHVLHLILTLVTCLGWGLVWLILAVAVKEKRHVVTVDAYGNVMWQG